MISVDSIITASPRQVACDLGDEVVVLSLTNDAYYGLDPVAARIWSLLQTPQSVAAIRDVLLAEYSDVDPAQCTSDVIRLLEQMAGWDLVQIAETYR